MKAVRMMTLLLLAVCAAADVGTTEGDTDEKNFVWCNCADRESWRDPVCASLCPAQGILGRRDVTSAHAERLCDCAVPATVWTRLVCYTTCGSYLTSGVPH
ncbi:uncharacterized protein [Branchiostoma lanceolatum]|uniref:uncharacterized protein n=1 Tax=Branchiostoma lanceolatum TaxID=7740 RepID=UPI003457173C